MLPDSLWCALAVWHPQDCCLPSCQQKDAETGSGGATSPVLMDVAKTLACLCVWALDAAPLQSSSVTPIAESGA